MSGLINQSADARSKTIGGNFRCRAWVRFNNAGTINGSGNVSSIDHSVTGQYVINFTSNMPDTNYVAISGQPLTGYDDSCGCQDYQVGSVDFDSSNGGAYVDRDLNCVAIFR
jgi:hypothetical protein